MKPVVPPSIEPLEPRLLLSVGPALPEAPLDVQLSPDNAIVVEQEPQAGTFSLCGSFSMSAGELAVFGSGGLVIDGSFPGGTWTPYTPTAAQTDITIMADRWTRLARVTLTFPDSSYQVSDWGAVSREGNQLFVDAQVERHEGPPEGGVTTISHDYDLGELPDGNYFFEVRAWDQLAMGRGFAAANTLRPVFRFWSPTHSRHFYTIGEVERDKLINQYSHSWTYEGVAYYAYPEATQADTAPVYRFWSPITSSHLYTMNVAERDSLIQNQPDDWIYEGVAFYAYAEEPQFIGIRRVHRFWSGPSHFFTADDREATKIHSAWSHVWIPEGIAWYTYGL